MTYFKQSNNHYYAFDGYDSILHINVDGCLINLITKDDFETLVNLEGTTEQEFLIYYKAITDSFNQLLFSVTEL